MKKPEPKRCTCGVRPSVSRPSDMGTLSPAPWSPPITENTERATIAARLMRINAEVLAMRRRGYVGTHSDEFEAAETELNRLLYHWQLATH